MSNKYLIAAVFLVAICSGILVFYVWQDRQGAGHEIPPPLHIHGYASVGATVSGVDNDGMRIIASVSIDNVQSYTPEENQEILVHDGDNITIYFSGIGDMSTWRSAGLKSGDRIWANLRAVVSFVDPYWECFDDNWGHSFEIF